MEDKLFVAKIAYSTSVDGVGLRNSLYVSGCPLHCEGCHNKSLWDINSGSQMTIEDVCKSLNADDFNISILGGEPMMQYDGILRLCKLIKKDYPNKTIWMWSGYTIEYIEKNYSEILQYIDVLVDGPFLQQYAEPNLQWRGSTNQRVIEIKTHFQSICK